MTQHHIRDGTFPALEDAIRSAGIKKRDIARLLHITPRGLSKKLIGENDFKLGEALLIHQAYFPNIPFVDLFKRKTDPMSRA